MGAAGLMVVIVVVFIMHVLFFISPISVFIFLFAFLVLDFWYWANVTESGNLGNLNLWWPSVDILESVEFVFVCIGPVFVFWILSQGVYFRLYLYASSDSPTGVFVFVFVFVLYLYLYLCVFDVGRVLVFETGLEQIWPRVPIHSRSICQNRDCRWNFNEYL